MLSSSAGFPIVHNCLLRTLRRYTSTAESRNYYQVLELLPHASLKEIKMQFKKLSIKYHPDVNAHLSDDEKLANNDKYVVMVQAYETLKDARKKREYDAQITSWPSSSGHASRPEPSEWHNKYYGEAKYYAKGRASTSHTSAGYNSRRHRVHNPYSGPGGTGPTNFSGEHRNYGDRNDVPHFDYNEHLAKHLKFEQRIYGKHLTAAEREAIVRQLATNGDPSTVSEELLTKHLMRQMKRTGSPRTVASQRSTTLSPYMYQGPNNGQDEESNLGMKTALVLGGAGSAYLVYHALVG